jgi:hypothetical protein
MLALLDRVLAARHLAGQLLGLAAGLLQRQLAGLVAIAAQGDAPAAATNVAL